ncbi:LysR family transcriptional regulator [Photobacterium phosphoreum]|uniref:LysR family transcriptional regulator n=1 Tax=Photobacterium phosphoreum TaxID=659 RepID=UPI0007F9305C|nr:LysR family transcriptional regulator [Photobacterium phosphoreum]OBU37996.1 transcriptional regulator [Photobacterium phosphoreum]PSW38857.1 LysR family transcriptional regulator [Photobacterium phosphoreum]
MLYLLGVFEQVVVSGSFSQAEKALNMAPSSVTRNIDKLENKIKTTLFKRSTRQLILTEDGQYFYQQSIKILEQSRNLLSEMQGNNNTPEGALRISVFETFGNIYLTNLIPDFLKRYPKIKIELELDNNLVDLNSDNIDIAIRIGTPIDSNLKARHLLTNTTSLVATPEYIKSNPQIKIPQDLKDHNCLIISHERQRTNWYFNSNKTLTKISVTGNLASKGGSPLLNAALQHLGVLLLSDWMVKPYIESKQLEVLLPKWTVTHNENTSGEIYAVYKSAQYLKPQIRAFLDYLAEQLQ